MFRSLPLICIVLSCVLLPMASATAAVLLLKDGGTLEGEILNPDEISRKVYRLKTKDGLEITLDARLVEREQRRERDALIEYNAKAPFTENTVENHHFWARWCGEQQLPDQAKMHWQQILELDPDHADARTVLGYSKDRTGTWYSQQTRRENQGFVQDRGRWKTTYQIEVENILADQEKESLHWRDTIRNLCRRLPESEAELMRIRDPAAFIALREALRGENNPRHQIILLRTLVRMPSDQAFQFVIGWSIRPDGTTEDVRQTCVEEIQKRISENPDARQHMIATYRSALRSVPDPDIIRLAAKVLGDVGGTEAIPELIEVLVTVRTEVVQAPTQQGYSFGSGGSGITHGTPPTITRNIPQQNQAALTALMKLTGKNYGFDKEAWQTWYWQPQRAPNINLRRN